MTEAVLDYKAAGVDIDKGDALVERIKKKVRATYDDRVVSGVGGFSALYRVGADKLIAAGTDGVGTKIKIAQQLAKHDSVGIDLVAMCVNDIICCGAKPLFFMDYIACGALDLSVTEALIDGIVSGCHESNMALIGGETAEMPGVYRDGEYDLAGFAIGEVTDDCLIDGSRVQEGDSIIAIHSSGLHSNGFSLARRLIKSEEADLLEQALVPTLVYANVVQRLNDELFDALHGLAHITGGGIDNIARVNQAFDYDIEPLETIPEILRIIAERSKLDKLALHRTFNMGMGFVIITDKPHDVLDCIASNQMMASIIGSVKRGVGKVNLR